MSFTRHRGQSLLEILIAIGMIVFFATAFLGLIVASYGRLSQSKNQSTAALLGNEGIRAVASIADKNWDALQCPVFPCTFGIRKNGNAYDFSSTPDITGAPPQTVFTRTVKIDPVWRNDGGDIVSATTFGAIPDSDARLVTVTMSWLNQVKRTVTAVFTSLVSRSHKTSSIILDTLDDFAGTSGSPAAPPQFHGTVPVRELVNGEVRTGTVGSFRTPQAVPSLVDLAEPSERVLAMVRDEDRLFSITPAALSVFSLDNISRGSATLVQRIPVAGTLTALAVGRNAIFLGKEDGSIAVILKQENPTLAVTATWNSLGTSPIRVLSVESMGNLLLVGKEHGHGAEFLALDLARDPSLTSAVVAFRQQLSATVTAIVSDGTTAFIGLLSNELVMLHMDSPTVTSHFLAGDAQPISSLAIDEDTLFVLRAPGHDEPELTAWRILQEPTERQTSLRFIAGKNLSTLQSPGQLLLLPASRQVAFTTGSPGREIGLITEDFSSTTDIDAPSGVTGRCAALAQDEQHLFAVCTTSHNSDALVTVIDAENPVGFTPWASYTSPVLCVPHDTNFRQWNRMKFRSSGQGYVTTQVRTGPTVNDVRANPWLGPEARNDGAFDDDALWHDISFLGGARCIEARVIFHGFATCPLTLDHLLFTYE